VTRGSLRRSSVLLRRRGTEHGSWAELDPRGLLPPNPRRRRRAALQSERWHAGQPFVLSGTLEQVARAHGRAGLALGERLAAPAGLERWLAGEEHALAPRFVVAGPMGPSDDERDLAKLGVRAVPDGRELWMKAARLSPHVEDRSLRLRVSFGREGDDDASRDEAAHALVRELAVRVLPGAAALEADRELQAALERILRKPVLCTQHIAYWNAPNGGALFHHDAFDEDAEGGQRGVLFVQLEGRTAWLTLSIGDLAERVREFVVWFEEGDLPWLRAELDDPPGRFGELAALATDRRTLLRELALPGCGRFGPLVNRGPEFTSFLADAGHALFLSPGDALVLPNHGYERTAMHSVFCASPRTSYGVSTGLRARS
jgi:hypothetical protein